ncbi:MAG: adenylate/guanylate cyclase domain-containing protein [Pseudomonadota bacterium]
MADNAIINEIGEWLIDQALAEPEVTEIFKQLCCRLYSAGIPLTRARLLWPTLHPLFQAETVLWNLNEEIEMEQFSHRDDVSPEWMASPYEYIMRTGVEFVRRKLVGENALLDFPVTKDFAAEGFTDYFLNSTAFHSTAVRNTRMDSGIFVSWASKRPNGFSEDDIRSLQKIQRRFATAVKTGVQKRIAVNITETYLGRHAGSEVLDGAIKLGDGRETQAVVWYADMRDSTALAEAMAPAHFLELLNDYFECTAAPAIAHGGEVLDFIGDAVLAIFPYDSEKVRQQAIRCATLALEDTLRAGERINAERAAAGKQTFRYGIGLNCGPLMFGNIGVPSRLAFSVIGPTINQAERIENLTKDLDVRVLTTREIAQATQDRWVSMGEHGLKGVHQAQEVFGLRAEVKG